MITYTFVLLSFISIPPLAYAANDWSVPCFQGICSYDVPQTDNTIPATMVISGSTNSISDITNAAGWEIVNCSETSTEQDIRMVCTGDDEQSAGCDHLYQNGAVGTIVRLPQSCGKGPFAHVSKAWTPEDQSIPQHLTAKLVKRDGSLPTVRALSLDMNFDKANTTHGEVSMFIVGSNTQDPSTQGAVSGLTRRALSKRFVKRQFDSIVSDFSLFPFNKTASNTPSPLSLVGDFPLLNTSIDCSSFSASLAADISSNSTAQVGLSVVIAGKLLPPTVDELVLIADLTADVLGTLKINADVQGSVDSGKIQVLPPIGFPGLTIPNLLEVGPFIKLEARAVATVDVDLDLAVDLAYKVDNTRLVFPPQNGQQSGGDATPTNDSPLQLSLSPGVTTKSSIEAHLIPSLNFGLNFNSIATANIFLELDASGKVGMNFSADADVPIAGSPDKSAGGNSTDTYTSTMSMPAGCVTTVTVTAPPAPSHTDTAELSKRDSSVQNVTFIGCVDVTGEVAANAGADANFFNLFDAGTKVPIFDKQFQIFQKCIGTGVSDDSGATPSSPSMTIQATQTGSTAVPTQTPQKRANPADLLCLLPDVVKAAKFL